MRRLLAAVVLLALPGCLDSSSPVDAAPQGPGITAARALDLWTGDCPCSLLLNLPDALGETEWLEARIRWDGTAVADFSFTLTTPDGSVVDSVRGFDARRIQIWGAAGGNYELTVTGHGSVEGDVRVRSMAPAADEERLPNLTTTIPVDIRIGNCDPVETFEQGATRCLRLGNGVANPGYGPLQVYLTYPEGAMALGGLGHFVQQVAQADGTWREKVVSGASFHATHAHWHYDGLADFSLHAVDEATGLRGEAVSAHKKAGFCFLDWDRMVEQETEEGAGGYAETDCLVPLQDGWSNGISAGWYDFYSSGLTDQYVDVAGVPDGVYEYVSVADPNGSLDEADPHDNAASVLIRLTGNSVEVLEKRGWYRVQDVDDPDA